MTTAETASRPTYIDDLGIGVRAQRVLAQAKIVFTTDLVRMTPTQLADLHGMGPTTLKNIKAALMSHSLALSGESA